MLDISEVSQNSGLPASTLRFYEEKGLIESIGRRGLRRLFDSDILERISLIRLGQSAGFKLDEMKRMFSAEGEPLIDRDQLVRKSDEIEQQVRRLQIMRDTLLHVAKCPAESHFDCPQFRRLMRVAMRASHSKTEA